MRRFFIVSAARELNLVFPSLSATAITLKNMHTAVDGASLAKQKMRTLAWAFSWAVTARVVSQYAVGVLWVCLSVSYSRIDSYS